MGLEALFASQLFEQTKTENGTARSGYPDNHSQANSSWRAGAFWLVRWRILAGALTHSGR
jgi:hypothetical protein